MIDFPDRIGSLIKRLEAGQLVTKKDVSNLADLQALDIAKMSEDFARQTIKEESDHTETLRQLSET